jgi:hypothetical protein
VQVARAGLVPIWNNFFGIFGLSEDKWNEAQAVEAFTQRLIGLGPSINAGWCSWLVSYLSVKVSLQVAETLEALHPGVRKDLRRALDDLDAGKKRDVRALNQTLVGH